MILEITFGFFIIVDSYIIWNLMRKTELLETWIENFTDTIQSVNDKIIEIDGKDILNPMMRLEQFTNKLNKLSRNLITTKGKYNNEYS